MAIRPLTSFEQPIADAVVDLGNLKTWEFAAYLEKSNGPLIEFVTRMRADGADPSNDVTGRTGTVLVHHNHLSQESLSSADWNGLTEFVSETFAHCADGTTYWGKVIDPAAVKIIYGNWLSIEMQAADFLFNILLSMSVPNPADCGSFFRKEVINRAMAIAGFVQYEFCWGSNNILPPSLPGFMPAPGPAGLTGASICQFIDTAALQIAPHL